MSVNERYLRELFGSNPSGVYTSEDLASVAYPDVTPLEPKHRINALRAARRIIASDPNWRVLHLSTRGALCVFFNADNVRSYGVAYLMLIHSTCGNVENKSLDQTRHIMYERLDRDFREYINAPHGQWLREVEIHRARRDGDPRRAEELRFLLEAEFQQSPERIPVLLSTLKRHQREIHARRRTRPSVSDL